MTKKTERHIWAAVGTFLFMLLVFLLLWLIRLSAVVPEQEEGIELAFVEEMPDTGGYPSDAPNPSPVPEDAPAAPAAPAVSQPTPATPPEHIVSEEETLAIERARKEKEEREAAERRKKEKEAAERKKAESLITNIGFNANGNANSQNTGNTHGGGPKTNPVGKGTGSSNGIEWRLDGRGIEGKLPEPLKTYNQDGRVIVEIRVNAAGNVISATIKGGTISDKQTQQLALDAAYKAKFTEGDHDQIGTITYNFKFN